MLQDEIKSGLHKKYITLSSVIEKLEPNMVAMMYKEYKNNNISFFPNLGIFFNEFALIYSIQAVKQKH